MKKYLYVTVFGFMGAVCRYLMGLAFNGAFPWGTLTVNLLGSFLLPFIFVFLGETGRITKELITAMGSGFIGAFTTFSAFTVETVSMLKEGSFAQAFVYFTVSLILGMLAAYAGVMISTYLMRNDRKKEDKSC